MGYIPRSIPFLSLEMRHLMVMPWGAGLCANSSRSWTSTSAEGSGAVGLRTEAASYRGEWDPEQLKLGVWGPELTLYVVVVGDETQSQMQAGQPGPGVISYFPALPSLSHPRGRFLGHPVQPQFPRPPGLAKRPDWVGGGGAQA